MNDDRYIRGTYKWIFTILIISLLIECCNRIRNGKPNPLDGVKTEQVDRKPV